MLFGEIAHKELFDLQAAGVPPGDAYQKWIGARAAGKTCGLRVQEEPFRRIVEGGPRTARHLDVTCAGEKFERDGGRLGKLGRGKPVANGKVLAKMIFCHACAQEMGDGILLIGRAERRWT